MVVYLIFSRDHAESLDNDSNVSGVFLNFTDALNHARIGRTHKDDECVIRLHRVNAPQDGVTICDSYTDEHRELCEVYRRYFPGGYPPKVVSG